MVESHEEVQRAPTGVGSSVGGAEAAAGPEDAGSAADGDEEADESADANAAAVRIGRRAKSFIVEDDVGLAMTGLVGSTVWFDVGSLGAANHLKYTAYVVPDYLYSTASVCVFCPLPQIWPFRVDVPSSILTARISGVSCERDRLKEHRCAMLITQGSHTRENRPDYAYFMCFW